MNRRTSRSSLMFTLGFLFFLIAAFAVFFTGVRVGADKVEAKYEKLNQDGASDETQTSYQQSDLVTFYHNVFSPYREFKREWNDQVNGLAAGSANRSDVVKNLRKLADEASSQVTQAALFTDSPLLEQGQLNILKSLRLFSEAAAEASSVSGSAETARVLKTGELAAGAKKYGLLGQNNYYAAMLKWGAHSNASIPADTGNLKIIAFTDWKKMPLLLKNASIAEILLNRGIFGDYDPQDVTAKIDSLLNSGMTASLNLNDVQSAISLLVTTGALKEEDFSKWRTQYYSKETLPDLPFFYD